MISKFYIEYFGNECKYLVPVIHSLNRLIHYSKYLLSYFWYQSSTKIDSQRNVNAWNCILFKYFTPSPYVKMTTLVLGEHSLTAGFIQDPDSQTTCFHFINNNNNLLIYIIKYYNIFIFFINLYNIINNNFNIQIHL